MATAIQYGQRFHYDAKVGRVVDGDTLDLVVDLGFHVQIHERFRLSDIDTPELNSSNPIEREAAKAAKARVEELCPVGSSVIVVSQKTGKFGRWLAVIVFELDGNLVSLNQLLLDSGHAVPYGEPWSHRG